ncbi:hypothetical protein CsSME_00053514 [Camellia sinensis var. sinensis]
MGRSDSLDVHRDAFKVAMDYYVAPSHPPGTKTYPPGEKSNADPGQLLKWPWRGHLGAKSYVDVGTV